MKWLIFGHKGWIGQQVIQILQSFNHEIFFDDNVRADNVLLVEQLIKKINPDRVISVIGRTHGPGFSTIDYLEQKNKLYENVRDNLYSPFVLSTLCNKYNIHLTYLGTGCIFTYDEKHNQLDGYGFTEHDKPNFFGSSYSIVKGFTDQMMKLLPNTLNVRIRMPITNEKNPRNFITKIVSYDKICSIHNSMTVLPELLPIMIDMAINKHTGTINLTNPGIISHNEILTMYKEIVDPDFTWKNFSIDEQNKILLSERSNNYLDTTKLEDLYPHVKDIKTSIKEMLQKYKN